MRRYYPIIYVRGYAFSDEELEQTTDDPTNGFNVGTTHIRQGRDNDIVRYRFPGPFVRLITEYGYNDVIRGLDDSVEGLTNPQRSIWIHRYYDEYSDSFGRNGFPGRPTIREAGDTLRILIDHVLDVCFSSTDDDRRVILIAHSMGGLICRSTMEGYGSRVSDVIEKVVTYGTPHGGIRGASDWFSYHGANGFTPDHIKDEVFQTGRALLSDVQGLSYFPPARFLCVIGTNAADYQVGSRMPVRSRWFMNGGSDGLVLVKNAFVTGAQCAYVHRSHSGRYGLVSSPEAFASVERFLFGNGRASVRIGSPGSVSPPNGSNVPEGSVSDLSEVSLVDFQCAIGPDGTVLSDRSVDHLSALQLNHNDSNAVEPELFTFSFLESDRDQDEYVCSISFRIHTQYYVARRLVHSSVSLRQSLELRLTQHDDSWRTTYRWLGQEQQETVGQEFSLTPPEVDLHHVWLESLRIIVRIADDEEEGTPNERNGEPQVGGGDDAEETVPVGDTLQPYGYGQHDDDFEDDDLENGRYLEME